MAKDPAFLFYTNDFERGVQFFSDEQVGKYLRLLMAQHQHGHLSEKQMIHICKSYDNDVFAKFEKDSAGLYYNERLELEIDKRKNFSLSRSKNKSGKTHTSKSYDNHMENEIENDNVIKKEKEKPKGGTGEKQKPPHPGVIEVIQYLNELNGTNLRTDTKATVRLIQQRFSEGYTLAELKEIIEYKVAEWRGTEQEKWIQPDTLFNGEKCAKYRNQVQAAKDKGLTASQIKGNNNPKLNKDDLAQRVAALYGQ